MGRQPLSAQVKKGLAAAFGKFDEYALAKYDRAGAVRLRDVLFLSHARPVDEAQAALVEAACRQRAGHARHLGGCSLGCRTRRGAEGDASAAKREVWERLLAERKLGALALLAQPAQPAAAGVSEELVLLRSPP